MFPDVWPVKNNVIKSTIIPSTTTFLKWQQSLQICESHFSRFDALIASHMFCSYINEKQIYSLETIITSEYAAKHI